MASLFEFLFDCLPIAIAHNGAYEAAPGERRSTIRDAFRRATLGELRQQMIRTTLTPPSLLRGPGLSPKGTGPRLWSVATSADAASVGRGTCRVRGQDFDSMVVFESIRWGFELGGSIAPFVQVTDAHGNALELPLGDEFLLDEWLVVSETRLPMDAVDMFPLENFPDFGLVRVFLYELDTDTMEVVPLDPSTFDIAEAAGWDRYERAAAMLGGALPDGVDLDLPIGEDLCAFEPFFSFEENEAIGGSIGVDERVDFSVQRPRFLVALSLQLGKESKDLEPGGVLGAAKFHPSLTVSASTLLTSVQASVRIERPHKTINLSHPGRCGCDEMHTEIKSLLVADANAAESIYPGPLAAVPYWGNLFSNYIVDPDVAYPGRQWNVVRAEKPSRSAAGFIERSAPGPLGLLTSDVTSKVAGQGDVDNVHLAPRMHLREATEVSWRVGSWDPWVVPVWRPISSADDLRLDPITMAPFCAHDCLHYHVRWSDTVTARHVLGWARDPALLDAQRLAAPGQLTRELIERSRSRTAKPYAEAGAPMFPPWHSVTMGVQSPSVTLSLRTIAPTLPGQRELMFHAPWAYGVYLGGYIHFTAGLAVAGGVGAQERAVLGRRTLAGPAGSAFIREIYPSDSYAAFYWMLRYRNFVRTDGSFASGDYRVVRNLEGAITL